MAKHEPALEHTYRFSPASVNQYAIRITFADYDTGKLEGVMQNHPFITAGYHRESAPSTKSSFTFRVNYNLWDPESGTNGSLTKRTGTLNLTADDHSYNNMYGTLTEDGGEPINVALTKQP